MTDDEMIDMAHTIFLRMAVRGGFDSYTGARLHEWLRIYESRPTKRATDLAKRVAKDEGWLNEKMCATCGHSESRHNTAGGFCKHCTCNAFVEPATTPSR